MTPHPTPHFASEDERGLNIYWDRAKSTFRLYEEVSYDINVLRAAFEVPDMTEEQAEVLADFVFMDDNAHLLAAAH